MKPRFRLFSGWSDRLIIRIATFKAVLLKTSQECPLLTGQGNPRSIRQTQQIMRSRWNILQGPGDMRLEHLLNGQMPKEKGVAQMLLLQQRPCGRDVLFCALPPLFNLFVHIHAVMLSFIRQHRAPAVREGGALISLRFYLSYVPPQRQSSFPWVIGAGRPRLRLPILIARSPKPICKFT